MCFTTMSDRLAVIQIERALLRIYYEQQIATLTLEPDQAQPLLFAEELSLPSDLYPTHHELVESLQQIGFEITPQAGASADSDENVYLITSVPKPLRPIGVADLITKTLGEYLDQVDKDDTARRQHAAPGTKKYKKLGTKSWFDYHILRKSSQRYSNW